MSFKVALAFTAGCILLPLEPVRLPAQPAPAPQSEAAPEWVTRVVNAPRLHFRTFESAAAKSKVSYHIYVPDAYDVEKERGLPVLYWLHGTGGGLAGVAPLIARFDAAIRAGKASPMLVVFANGLKTSMWCDSKDGGVPMETVVVKELVPHVDASFRTIASPEGRIIEGFSMGGYGAARLGFKHPSVFGSVSILGGGPLDLDFKGPRAIDEPAERERIFESVWGSDLGYYRAQSPWILAKQNRDALASRIRIRQVVGDRDAMLAANRALDGHLTRLGIPHEFLVLPGVGHNPLAVLNALGESNWEFHRVAANKESAVAPAAGAGTARAVFFGFSKAMLKDGVLHQQRAWDAVQWVKERMDSLGFASRLIQEQVRSPEDYAKKPAPFLVHGRGIVSELEWYRRSLGSQDSVVIYSHSHGLKGRSERSGGLLLDDFRAECARPTYLDWREYSEQLLRLPAKSVVVLTMACHSGGLVDYLNGDESIRGLWQSRKEQGRNFLVITSQNGHSLSNPRRIGGRIINPFTHAVIKAFEGEADGYQSGHAKRNPDGRITLGELAAFIRDEARKHTAPGDKNNDPDPQLAGSFDPETVIAVMPAESS